MPRFSANLSFLYSELAFLDRIGAAARDGFPAVEYLGPYDFGIDEIAAVTKGAGVAQALFNLPFGDWATGERGIAALPGRATEFREGVDLAIAYAKALNCPKVNALAGVAPPGAATAEFDETFVENLRFAAPRLADAGIELLIEPINTRDIPGFFLSGTDQALRIIDAVGHDNLKIQYDIYHMQIMQGDLIPTYQRLKSRIGHIQIADNPGRHEPGTGEINYRFVLSELDRLGYDGFVGCEYRPRGGTSEGLGWMRDYTGSVS
jgi:hydroxypyruvate isomerase